MKKLFSALLSFVLVLSLAGCGSKPEATGVTGTFSATTKGHNADLTVEVVLNNSHIDSVKLTDHKETPGISDKPIAEIPAAIVKYQSVNIDTIQGASVTSKAILTAVSQVLTEQGLKLEDYNQRPEAEKAEDQTIDVDVVVIGGGGAGLAAATQAGENGAKVLVVEKMPIVGGNTLISGGGYNAVDPKRQLAMPTPIEDSVELFIEQTLDGGATLDGVREGDPELVRVLCEGALDGVEFLEKYGMEWQDEISMAPGGLYYRRHMPVVPNGVGYINALKSGCEKNGVEIMTNTKAESLIMKDGKACGVVCTGETGNKVTVNANAVILATGGFGANVEMREHYNDKANWPTLGEQVGTTNSPCATGDGIDMALEAGAQLVDMKWIQLFAYGDPDDGKMAGSCMKKPADCIYVNLEGERFVNESERRDVCSAAALAETKSQMYVILDGTSYPTVDSPTDFGSTPAKEIEKGNLVMADTIAELAEKIGVKPETLQATIDKYNAGVDAGKDEYGKEVQTPDFSKIEEGPFYANLRTPVVHHTMGGVKINTDAQVIAENGQPIEGLFAAGEVCGDIHGTNRVGANALTEIIVFGRIAGENAAALK